MEIPVNENKRDYEAEVTQKFLNELKDSTSAYLFKSQIGSEELGLKVARAFVRKGYYAKIVYFVESWKGYQGIAISKQPLKDTCARMVYSEMIH